ncbi:MAG: TIGR00282 family metallophosphoesterase [Bacillota bacterium]|nr:TIGR00282 family metallophosphoesterase [Bacillota bacterium]
MNLLMIGDIVGKPGRKAVKEHLPTIQKEYNISFTIANGENAAGGRGLTRDIKDELIFAGIDVITMGNHVWDNKDILNFVDDEPRVIRPANYPSPCPGQGYHIFIAGFNYKIAVINASGRVFMPAMDCPFQTVEKIVDEVKGNADIIIVDFHAEATSEKLALAHYLDGKVSAVAGTHTHIQTADEKILPAGTGYISDLGMTGPSNSILGMDKENVIKKFISCRPARFEVATGPVQFEGLVISIDEKSFKTTEVKRISRKA